MKLATYLVLLSSLGETIGWTTSSRRLHSGGCSIEKSCRGSAIPISHRQRGPSSLRMSLTKRASSHDSIIEVKKAKVPPVSEVPDSHDCPADDLCDNSGIPSTLHISYHKVANALLIAATIVGTAPREAIAATGGASPIASAFTAYGHYLGLLAVVACLVTERLLLEKAPSQMTPQEEDQLAIADILYGVFGLLVFGTGYSRAVGSMGKGFDFYSHVPFFWLKIALVGVLASASFFNTTIIIQRSVAKRNASLEVGEDPTASASLEPMSEALAAVTVKQSHTGYWVR
jgi:putative membrane protein